MNQISSEHLLQQIRSLGSELQVGKPVVQQPQDTHGGFGNTLKATLDAVNESQARSSDLKTGFLNGTGEASLAEVMIASQKANLQFRAVAEVRNKLITAYQDIMNMPV